MKIKNFFKLDKGDSEYNLSKIITTEANCINDAQVAADIVNEVVESGNLDALPEKLDLLANKYDYNENFTFKYRNIALYYLLSILSGVFIACFLYFIVIDICTLLFSSEYRILMLVELLISVAAVIFNCVVIKKSVDEIKFKKRYDVYFQILKYRNIELLFDLALYSKRKEEMLIKDLKKAIKRKLIPQGHFGRNNIIFITNDVVFDKYNEKPAVYDRYYIKQIEERERINERPENIQQILDTGKLYIEKIHDSNDIIKDKSISKKLDSMEQIVSTIFHEVDINPNQADKMGLFLNYYLPTAEKLLLSYIDISEKNTNTKSLEKTRKDIESALDKLNSAFDGILSKFYREQELDISSDISAMEIVMKQEGLID